MKRIVVLACCLLLLAGCSQKPADNSSSDKVDLQKVEIGGYAAWIPSEWNVVDNYIYFGDPSTFPYASWTVLSDYNALDDLFSYDGAEADFVEAVRESSFSGTSSGSEIKRRKYVTLESRSFTVVGNIDDQTFTCTYDLFDNPGGGVLSLSLTSDDDNLDYGIQCYADLVSCMALSQN